MDRQQVLPDRQMKQTSESPQLRTVDIVIVPDWGGGDKVDSGIGLSYRPAKLHRLAGRYDNRSQLYRPSQGLWMWLQKGDREETERVCRGGDRLQYKRTDAFRRGGRLVGLKRKCLFPFSRKFWDFLSILTKFHKKSSTRKWNLRENNSNFCKFS